MKLVKNCVFSVLLATVLAVSASAGELDMPGAPKPGVTASDEPKIVAYGDPDATVTKKRTPPKAQLLTPWRSVAACGFVCPGSPIKFEQRAGRR
jgi:hypothetical protein